MRKIVYSETSVISYLCARTSRDIVLAAHQSVTQDWWDHHRKRYDCYVSEFVLQEVAAGDPEAAGARMSVAEALPQLAVTSQTAAVARELLLRTKLSKKVAVDLAHIATAAVYGIDYLLTWNCAHIANPHWQPQIRCILESTGYACPVICTPLELLEGESS